MIKEIGAQELVYATIVRFVEQKASISIEFKHDSGTKADHCLSLDKQKYVNCYNQLETGNRYIIVTEHVANKRWVWRKCLLVTKNESDAFRKIAGLCPSPEQMQEAMQMLRDLRNPPLPPSLTELLEF